MRLPVLIAALAVAAPIGFYAGSAAAQFIGQDPVLGRPLGYGHQGAWCANQDTGGGRVEQDCSFDSFERCRRLVVSGNRGTCSPNPLYAGPQYGPPRKHKKKRRY
jgi:hypothetical protein